MKCLIRVNKFINDLHFPIFQQESGNLPCLMRALMFVATLFYGQFGRYHRHVSHIVTAAPKVQYVQITSYVSPVLTFVTIQPAIYPKGRQCVYKIWHWRFRSCKYKYGDKCTGEKSNIFFIIRFVLYSVFGRNFATDETSSCFFHYLASGPVRRCLLIIYSFTYPY